jgi:hypothetical protein
VKVELGGGDIFSIIPLTDRHENVVSFIDDSDFNAFGDDDEYTYFWHGLHQCLKDGGFNSSHTNILCILGRSPDVENEGFRRRTEAADLQAKSYKSRATIYETLGKLNVDVLAFTPASESAAPVRDDVVDFCRESAILQYETYKNVSEVVNNFIVDRPDFNSESSRVDELMGGATIAKIYKAQERVSDCGNFFEDGVDEIVTFRQELWKQVSKIFDYGIEQDEQKVSQGEYGPALAKLIQSVYQQNEAVFKQDDLQNLLRRKFKLFTQVHIPVHVKGAKYPTCRFVVFFNEEELKKHQEIVARLHEATQQADLSKGEYKNRILENLSLNIGQLLGIKLSADDIGNMSVDELEIMITGVQKETGHKVAEGTMTVNALLGAYDASTKAYWQKFLDTQYKYLQAITGQGPKYQFSYVTSYGEVYFWVPIEHTQIFPPGK